MPLIIRLSVFLLLLSSIAGGQTSQVGGQKSQQASDLTGLWDTDLGDTVEIVQKGDTVLSKYQEVKNKDYGFKAGDWDFRGARDGIWLTVEQHRHYPFYPPSVREKCAKDWDSKEELKLVVSPDGSRLQGVWTPIAIGPDCKKISSEMRRIEYDRRPVFDADDGRVAQSSGSGQVTKQEPDNRRNQPAPLPLPAEVFYQKPTSIAIILGQLSALLDTSIQADIGLKGISQRRVYADQDYKIAVSADGGLLQSGADGEMLESLHLTLKKGEAQAIVFIRPTWVGAITIRASAEEGVALSGAQTKGYGCGDKPIADYTLASATQFAPSDGQSSMELTVSLVDAQIIGTAGEKRDVGDVPVGFAPSGVGTWRPAVGGAPATSNFAIPNGQCVGAVEVSSKMPGRAQATITLLKKTETRDFIFLITWLWLLWSALGGLLGGGVKRFLYRGRSARTRNWTSHLVVAAGAGVLLLLLVYLGVVTLKFSPDAEQLGIYLPLTIGFLGGYLGRAVFDASARITKRWFGGGKSADAASA